MTSWDKLSHMQKILDEDEQRDMWNGYDNGIFIIYYCSVACLISIKSGIKLDSSTDTEDDF